MIITAAQQRHGRSLRFPRRQLGRLEQGVLTLGALATVSAVWLAIGLPHFQKDGQGHSRPSEAQFVAYAGDSPRPRLERVPSIPKHDRPVRHRLAEPGRHVLRTQSAISRPPSHATPPTLSRPTVAPTDAAQPRVEAIVPSQAAAQVRARDTSPEAVGTTQAAPSPDAPPNPQPAPTGSTSSVGASEPPPTTPTTSPSLPDLPNVPPVTTPSLPDLPDVTPPDLPPPPSLPSLPTIPPPPVPLPQTPPLPTVQPPAQPPAVEAPTQTLPNVP